MHEHVWQYLYYADLVQKDYADSQFTNNYARMYKSYIYEKAQTQCVMCGGYFHTDKNCGAKEWFQQKLFNADQMQKSFKADVMRKLKGDHKIYAGVKYYPGRWQRFTGSGKRINNKQKEINAHWYQHGERFMEEMQQDINPFSEHESVVSEGSDNIQNMTTNRGVRKRETKMKNKYLDVESNRKSKIRVPKLLGEQSWRRVEVPKLLDNKCKSLTLDDSIRLSVRSTQQNSYDLELTPSIKHFEGQKPDERQFNYLGDLEQREEPGEGSADDEFTSSADDEFTSSADDEFTSSADYGFTMHRVNPSYIKQIHHAVWQEQIQDK